MSGRSVGIVLAVGLALTAGHGPGRAAGVRELPDGWLLPPGALMVGREDPRAQAGSWAAWGGCRLYSVPDLPETYLAAGWAGLVAGVPLGVQGDWQTTGGELFQEDRVRLQLRSGRAWGLGLGAERRTLAVGGQPGPTSLATTLSAHGTWQWPDQWVGRWRWHFQLASGPQRGNGAQRWLRQGEAVVLGPGHALALNLLRRRTGELGFGLELGFPAGTRVVLGVRADTSTGSVGPTLRVRAGSLVVLTSHLQHPALGATHRIMVLAGNWQGAWF